MMVAVAVAAALAKWIRPYTKKSLGIVFLVLLVCRINCGLLQSAHRRKNTTHRRKKGTILKRWWKKEKLQRELEKKGNKKRWNHLYYASHSKFAISIQAERKKERKQESKFVVEPITMKKGRRDQIEAFYRWHGSFALPAVHLMFRMYAYTRHLRVSVKIAKLCKCMQRIHLVFSDNGCPGFGLRMFCSMVNNCKRILLCCGHKPCFPMVIKALD